MDNRPRHATRPQPDQSQPATQPGRISEKQNSIYQQQYIHGITPNSYPTLSPPSQQTHATRASTTCNRPCIHYAARTRYTYKHGTYPSPCNTRPRPTRRHPCPGHCNRPATGESKPKQNPSVSAHPPHIRTFDLRICTCPRCSTGNSCRRGTTAMRWG